MEKNNKESLNNEQIIIKQKKSWLTMIIVVAIGCSIFLACSIGSLIMGEITLGVFLLLFSVVCSILIIWFAFKYKKRTDQDWINEYKKSKGLSTATKDFETIKESVTNVDSAFFISKVINIDSSGRTEGNLFIDNRNKKFIYQENDKFSKSYSFSDLINYEVYENGKSQVQGRAGSALLGGAFFGLGGMIVGNSMSRSIAEKCTQLKLIIRLNDFKCPEIAISYVDTFWDQCNKDGPIYKTKIKNLQSVCSMLEYILNQKTLEESVKFSKEQNNAAIEKSDKEKLKELKEMLDEDLITVEEYEKKKQQILGL